MIINSTLKDLRCRLDYVARVIDYVNKKLVDMPAGSLKIKRQGNSVSYYCAISTKGIKNVITIKDAQLISALAQKSYLLKIKRSAEREYSLIRNLLDYYPDTIVEDIYDGLREDRKKLITPVAISDEEYARQWQEKSYKRKPFEEGDPNFLTLKGERVRSKSEQIIADRLNYNGIPYRYECPIRVGNRTFHPDFTVLRKRDRREFYWEHCGAMDRQNYSDYAVNRFNIYADNDILLGRDLFATFETGNCPLDTATVDKLINAHFK